MKLTTQQETEITEAYKSFWVANLSANMEIFGSYLVDDFSIIGSAKGETFFSREDTIAFYSATAEELKDKAELRNRVISVQAMDEQSVIVNELCDLYVLIENDWTFYGHARISCVMKKIDGEWKAIHQHASFPDHRTEEGRQLAAEKIEKENLELKEAVQRRTVELEYKNRELEIEAALERIRAVAMGMSSTNDLIEITKVQFTELQQLGFEDVRNSLIGIFHDRKDYFTDYDYSDICGGNITDIPINGNVIIERAIKRMKSATDVFTEFVVEGQDMSEWKAFREKNGEYDDPRIKDADVLYYYFYSVNNGIVGISTFKRITSGQLDILKKFRNVFDLAYKRYLDISKAEAQAREAQIEAAVERVRTQSMAMQQTTDIAKVNEEIFSQISKLNIDGFTGVAIYLVEEDEMVTVWDLSSPASMSDANSVAFRYDPKKTPTLSEFIPIWKAGELDYFVMDYPKETLLTAVEELEPYYPVMAENFRTAISSGALKHQWNATATISHGILSLDMMKPPTDEVRSITIKMAAAFNHAHQRFYDLQKAEAQTREAQVEAALERVRSRTMGMQKSEELKEVIQVVYDQFVQLKIPLEHTGFVLDYKNRNDYNIWIADQLGSPSNVVIPYFDSVYYNRFNQAKKEGLDFFAANLTTEEKNSFYLDLFRQLPGFPEASKKFILEQPALTISTVLLDNVSLYIENFSGIPYTDETNSVLMRLGKVFEQTYTRFLDLQKAEAQARESQIEMALEKVRSRTMAMQHSDELADASFVLDTQVRSLGIQTWGCAFNIYGETESTEWFSSAAGTLPPYKTPREDFFLRAYSAGQRGEQLYIETFEGAACKAHYDYLQTIPVMGDAVRSMIANGGSFPEHQTDHATFFKYGYLLFITPEPMPHANEIFIRFAKVFEQTYTRFLDLQKAEAQAREAQIEASLERVRARAMAMHVSDDLQNAVAVVFEELDKLNPGVLRVGISVLNKEKRNGSVWLTSVDEGKAVQVYGDESFDFHPLMKGSMDAWIKQEDFYYVLEGDDLTRYYKGVEAARFGLPESQLLSSGNEYKRQSCYVAVYNAGGLFAFMEGDFPEEAKKVMRRFAAVFDLTYKRFLDLQKAEAQAFRAEQDLIEIKAARQKAEDTLLELKETQQQLIHSEKMASLGELTAGIAHEIQNPLNFVNNFSDVSNELLDEMNAEMEKGDLEEARSIAADIKSNLEKINHHGKRADAIVKGMLQHSRKSEGQKEPTDINALCDEYLRLSYHGLRAKDKSFNATLKTDFDESIGKINISPQEIGRVIMNLLTNAFYAVNEKAKHATQNLQPGIPYQPTVLIQTKKNGDTVFIRVKDNGSGIPLHIVDKIFQPFFTTKPTGQGTGLGLSLAYDIIKAHGAALTVETVQGEGSTFIIKIPAS